MALITFWSFTTSKFHSFLLTPCAALWPTASGIAYITFDEVRKSIGSSAMMDVKRNHLAPEDFFF
jgi:hypothetical protein